MRSTGARRLNRPVWVKLSVLYRQIRFLPAQLRGDARTLDVTGEAPGALHRWYRSTTGEWYGLVSYTITHAAPAQTEPLRLDDQLVPAEALRPRTYGR